MQCFSVWHFRMEPWIRCEPFYQTNRHFSFYLEKWEFASQTRFTAHAWSAFNHFSMCPWISHRSMNHPKWTFNLFNQSFLVDKLNHFAETICHIQISGNSWKLHFHGMVYITHVYTNIFHLENTELQAQTAIYSGTKLRAPILMNFNTNSKHIFTSMEIDFQEPNQTKHE